MRSVVVAASLLAVVSGVASAQKKTIPGESITATATIEAIDPATRTITIKDDTGVSDTIVVPQEVKRFDALKVGDTIVAQYYSSVIVRLKKPGEAPVDVEQAQLTAAPGEKPAGTAGMQRTITADVIAVDMNAPSITIKGPGGLTYMRKVQDKKALAQVKVGDQLDITWTDAVLISVQPKK
jgi:Cu/Ag efflux protein CusF